MARWGEFVAAEPEFAGQVRGAFDAHQHKTLATLRRDGAPRVSGIESSFVDDELWFGSMPGALKARDLRRDPRFALHGPPVLLGADNPATASGDAKMSGRAIEVTDRGRIEPMLVARGLARDAFPDSHFFTADIEEAVLVRIEGSHMAVTLWRPGQELRRFNRT